MREVAGDTRPIGELRALVATSLILRPWDTSREPVTAHLTLFAPLPSLVEDPRADPPDPDSPPECGRVGGRPGTATHLRELLTQLGFCTATGLDTPAGGTVDVALTDPDTGALRAVATPHQLRHLARNGCPEHPDPPRAGPPHTRRTTRRPSDGEVLPEGGHERRVEVDDDGRAPQGCPCPVLGAPPPTDASRRTAAPPHRRTAAPNRYTDARDRTCRHPGCSRPARFTDADHLVAFHEGGRTECSNLCNLCRRHHRLQTHAPGWRYAMTPDGRLSVTTPSGITRTSAPPGTHHRLRPDDLLHPLETSVPELPGPDIDPADDPPPF